VLLQAFRERGISGLFGRQIQDDKYGIVRGLFLPEWFCHFRDRNGGIDWVAWETAARSHFEQSFYEATLVWSDEILKAILELTEEGSISVESICLESYAAVVLFDSNIEQTLGEISRLNEPDSFSAAEICRSYIMGSATPSQAANTKQTLTREKRLAELTPEERELIEWVEAVQNKELTVQEINLALEQAKHIGEIADT
jgi:hypothetical protein